MNVSTVRKLEKHPQKTLLEETFLEMSTRNVDDFNIFFSAVSAGYPTQSYKDMIYGSVYYQIFGFFHPEYDRHALTDSTKKEVLQLSYEYMLLNNSRFFCYYTRPKTSKSRNIISSLCFYGLKDRKTVLTVQYLSINTGVLPIEAYLLNTKRFIELPKQELTVKSFTKLKPKILKMFGKEKID